MQMSPRRLEPIKIVWREIALPTSKESIHFAIMMRLKKVSM